MSRYRNANPVPTSLLADNSATVPSGPVILGEYESKMNILCVFSVQDYRDCLLIFLFRS